MTTVVNRLRQLLFPKAVLNNGSQLRDHLANERTFLSWTRMGLAFAAMALALGRLGMIDHVFSTTQLKLQLGDRSVDMLPSKDKPMPQNTPGQATRSGHEILPNTSGSDILASQLCWGISLGSFGYGILRYVSVRRTLIQGRFVPAIWGPVLMTTCSLGSLATLLYSGNEFPQQRHEARV